MHPLEKLTRSWWFWNIDRFWGEINFWLDSEVGYDFRAVERKSGPRIKLFLNPGHPFLCIAESKKLITYPILYKNAIFVLIWNIFGFKFWWSDFWKKNGIFRALGLLVKAGPRTSLQLPSDSIEKRNVIDPVKTESESRKTWFRIWIQVEILDLFPFVVEGVQIYFLFCGFSTKSSANQVMCQPAKTKKVQSSIVRTVQKAVMLA